MRRNWLIAAVVLGLLAIVIAVLAMRLSDDGAQAVATSAAAPTLRADS
jgi:hypothetical protein